MIMINLKKRWKMFLNIIFDPFTLLLTISVSILLYFSNEQASPLIMVLITIASAILGGRLNKLWSDIIEGKVITARGKAAVRNLKLLLVHISVLKQKVIKFQDSVEQDLFITRTYEEIESFCSVLEEEAVNSIENWTDILPEADIKTQIGIISDLNQSLKDKEDELLDLNNKYSIEKFNSDGEREQLGFKIKEKESQITALEKEINSLSWPHQTGLLSSLLNSQTRIKP